MKKENNTAVLVVSFGTTHLDTLEKCIAATEKTVADQFPGCPLYRAFLSRIVIRRLKEKYQISADTVKEALSAILRDGYRQVIVQPTLVLGGIEYDILRKQLAEEKDLQIALGTPLITGRSDCEELANIIMEENPLCEKEALVLMGHGTEHEANEVYEILQEIFAEKGYDAFIGTVESTPSFQDAVKKLVRSGAEQARLLPLMFVAGDHAKNDMAGDEDSLLCMVQEVGIKAVPVLKGLGESETVRSLYARRAVMAAESVSVND